MSGSTLEDSILIVSVPTNAPPQVAWEFLTKPGQRMTWQPWVTEVTIKGATGGRRGLGSANHCMHGKDAVVEEILDWRPYDYVTDRTILATPEGPVKVLHTIELEPQAEGTMIHFLYGPAKTRREKAAMEVIAPAYGAALRSGLPSLIAQLDAALAARDADVDLEPELPAPQARQHRVLTGLVGRGPFGPSDRRPLRLRWCHGAEGATDEGHRPVNVRLTR